MSFVDRLLKQQKVIEGLWTRKLHEEVDLAH